MTGERRLVTIAGLEEGVLERERRMPQPGSRQPAPGELVLLQSFINTHFDLVEDWGSDLLAEPHGLLAWLTERGLARPGARPPGRAEVKRVLALREGLRDLARCNQTDTEPADPAALRRLNEVVGSVSIGVELDTRRLSLFTRARGTIDAAVGTLLAIAANAMIDGRWQRMKSCPGEHCGWVFYDHSRNNSSRWCSMAVCGGRTKARSHYRRHRRRA